MNTIRLAEDFSRFPAGRHVEDGPLSGQKFRTEFLVPGLANRQSLTVELDGTLGYGSSFLEEAFGGLVREHGMSAPDLRARLTLVSSNDVLLQEIWAYIDEAKRRR